MVPEVILAAMVLALLMGGRIDRLADAPIKRGWLLAVPVVTYAGSWLVRLQTDLPASSWVFGILHLASIGALLLLCVTNIRIPGAALIAVGLVLNAIAIATNGGFMPASPDAVAQVFGQDYLNEALNAPHVRSSFVDSSTNFGWLCDVIPKTIGLKFSRGVYSVGDMVMTLGIFISIIALSRVPKEARQRASA